MPYRTVVIPWHYTGDKTRKLTPDELIKTLQIEMKTCRVRTKDTTTTQNIGDENLTDECKSNTNPTPDPNHNPDPSHTD